MSPPIEPVKDAGDASLIGEALAEAFHDAPNFKRLLPEEAHRKEALPWFFAFTARLGLIYGEVHATPDRAAAAVWMRPGRSVGFIGALRAGALAMPFRFGWNGFRRSLELTSTIEEARHRAHPEPHWYLVALGVAPPQQGKGLGPRLIQPVLDRAGDSGVPCYLETFHEDNVAFYRDNGFAVVLEDQAPGLDLPFWGMTREPSH